ncbi:GAF domain-containing protein [Alloiococcus sp. CFN-8]|uniref:GAF domain-containing protein n=1 Tax=Alloiococcus sp. CFN-8 TaxID=3416081 RepID=UPI003CF8B92E
MFDMKSFVGMTRKEKYENLLLMLKGILEPEEEEITKLSNAAALINALSEDISWCGFYLLRGKELILGPFQGLPACTKIGLGKGVCGTSAEKREIIIVEDVDKFPGHIACDSASRSEIVLPIIKEGKLIGVLDIDSTTVDRFTEEDKNYLKEAVAILAETL